MGYINPRKFDPSMIQKIRSLNQEHTAREVSIYEHTDRDSKPKKPSGTDGMMEGFKRAWTQLFPPAPAFTEQSIGDLTGRVS